MSPRAGVNFRVVTVNCMVRIELGYCFSFKNTNTYTDTSRLMTPYNR